MGQTRSNKLTWAARSSNHGFTVDTIDQSILLDVFVD